MASTLNAQTAPERHHADRREVTEGTRRDDAPRHLLEKLHHKAPTVEGGMGRRLISPSEAENRCRSAKENNTIACNLFNTGRHDEHGTIESKQDPLKGHESCARPSDSPTTTALSSSGAI